MGGRIVAIEEPINTTLPVITALSPNTGTQGTAVSLTINGNNLANASSLSFNPSTGISVTNVSSTATQVTATVTIASGATLGPHDVSVTTPNGTSGSLSFTVTSNAPSLSSLSPAAGTQGATVALVINGTNLANTSSINFNPSAGISVANLSSTSTQVTATVTIDVGAAIGSYTVSVTTLNGTSGVLPFAVTSPNAPQLSSLSPSTGTQGTTVSLSITVQTPAHASGTVSVVVTNSGGQPMTLANGYTYNPAPTVASISPTTGIMNGGTVVTLTGTGFLSGAAVSFGGAGGTGVNVTSSTSINATTPAHVVGPVDVVVTNPDGQSGTLLNGYTYVIPLPAITPPLVPSSGAQGQVVSLTINGSNLSGATSVNFSPATGITVSGITSDATHVWATVTIDAAATTGSRTVSVTTPNGTGGSASFAVNPPNPVPTISTLSPSSVFSGNGAFTLTVNGSNFISGSQVQIGGSNRTTTYVNATQLTAQITSADVAAAGALTVTVVNSAPGGGTSNSATLTVNGNPVPTITTISPTNVSAGSSTFTLTVNGTNYVKNSVVRVNGSNRTTTYVSGTQLTAQIPSSDVATAGTLTITVFNTTPGGGASNSSTLTANASNYSLSLDGTANTYAATSGSSLAISGPITVEAWVKTTSASMQEVVRRYSNFGSGGYELYVANGYPYFWIRTTPSYSSVYVQGTTSINNGAWRHIAGVFDGSTLKLYVDGALCGTTYSSITYTSDTSALAIGIYLDYGMYQFNGLIDEVRVTASAVYTGNFTPDHHPTALPNTKGLWKFDGMSSLDSSGNGANLTLYGNAAYSTDTP